MQISGSGIPPLFRLSLSPQTLKSLPLQDGETVTATVQHSDTPGKLNLDINGKLLQVISTLRLTAGMSLQLRVEKSNDQLLLHLDDKTVRQLVHHQAVRQSLPVQEPLKPLIERLQQLLPVTAKATTTEVKAPPATSPPSSNTSSEQVRAMPPVRHTSSTTTTTAAVDAATTPQADNVKALPRQVQQSIERLLAVLPLLKQISGADGLKQAIASSGLFLESSLLQSQQTTSPDKDVKTALLRLARTIRQSLAVESGEQPLETSRSRDTLQTLLRQVDAGLARIQLHQLNSITAQQATGDERQLITLELPLLQPQEKGVELLQLKIQRDKATTHSGSEECWSVTLHLSPADYGDIHAVVSLTGGKVSTTFWCQEEQTGRLFSQQIEDLQRRLNEQGLEVGRCTAITGTAPEGVSPDITTELTGLIDTQA